MLFRLSRLFLLLVSAVAVSACRQATAPKAVADMMWDEIEANALGREVKLLVSRDDPEAVHFLKEQVGVQLRRRYGIRLTLLFPPPPETAPLLDPPPPPEPDLVWMDLDAFHQYRAGRLLQPGLVAKVPNAALIDWSYFGRRIERDDQQAGSVVPWGKNPLMLVYNRDNVEKVPTNLAQLAAWVRQNPGRFTIHRGRSGYRMLHSWLREMAQPPNQLPGTFSESDYAQTRDKLVAFIEALRPYFWMEGEHFPKDAAELDLLFSQGKVDFSIHEGSPARFQELADKPLRFRVGRRVWPCPEAMCAHFLGIPVKATNKEGALVVLNELLSPQAQWQKQDPDIWGDGSVLDVERLPDHWRTRFLAAQSGRTQGRADTDLAAPQLAMTYWVHLRRDLRPLLEQER